MEMRGGWSEGVERESVRLSGLLPYEEVAVVMARLGQVHLSKASVWREAQEYGRKFQALEEQERISAMVPPAQWHTTMTGVEPVRKGVSMDGGMVYILGEGWKELKVGGVFEVGIHPGVDRESKEAVALPNAEAISYVAHLGGSPTAWVVAGWSEPGRGGWRLLEMEPDSTALWRERSNRGLVSRQISSGCRSTGIVRGREGSDAALAQDTGAVALPGARPSHRRGVIGRGAKTSTDCQ